MIPGHRSDLPHRSEADQAQFHAVVQDLSVEALRRAGRVVRRISVAGTDFRLVFAGPLLADAFMPALSHREVDDVGPADYSFHIWDSASTGVTIAPPPVEQHCFSDRGDIWTFHSRRWRSAFHWSDFSLQLLDAESGNGIFWMQSATAMPYWSIASPMRTLFHWAMERRGAQLIHAAAVGTEAGGVLVTGRGGVGKSTTALACLAAGLAYVGDDYVVLTGGDAPAAHSLYRTAKINVADMARFSAFEPRLIGDASHAAPKAVIYLEHGIVDALPLRSVVTPAFHSAAESRIEPIAPALLIGAATFTTNAQLPHSGQHNVDFIERHLSRLPCHRLQLGTDPDQIVCRITELAASAAQPVAASVAPTPLISVVIPCHNGAHFLPQAVASILAQDHPKLEIIVVDDGSTDDLATTIRDLPVEVRLLRQDNGGPAAARNTGIRAASADIIAFLDVDDLWPPDKLAVSLAWLAAHPGTDAVTGQAQLMEAAGTADDYCFVGSPSDSFAHYIGAALFRRRAFSKGGLFDPLLRFGEDIDWFANAAHAGLVVDRLDMVTLHVRRHAANSTRDLNGVELSPVRLIRNALDRKRAAHG